MKVIKIGTKYSVYAEWNSRGRLKIRRIEKIDDSMFEDLLFDIRALNDYENITLGVLTNDISEDEKKKVIKILKRNRMALLTVDDFVHDKSDEFKGVIYLRDD